MELTKEVPRGMSEAASMIYLWVTKLKTNTLIFGMKRDAMCIVNPC